MKLVVLDANAFWTEQLFRQCGRFADVLLLKPRDFRAHRAATGSWLSENKPRQLGERLWEQKLSMPPGWMFRLWPLAQRKFARAIRDWTSKHDPGSTTLVLTYPQYRCMIPALKPARVVYYNFDDYRDNWPGHGADVPQWERELVEQTDVTVCIADYRARFLREQHPAKAAKIFHLPIGCTPEFMAVDADEPKPARPAKLAQMSGPVVGHIGALNWRFDYAFLAEVAAKLPQVNFVLGGKPPVETEGDAGWAAGLRAARACRNVHFIGWVAHGELAQHLKFFDALFMCYSVCNFNRNACPAKLWDYLGSGRLVIANERNPETLLWREVMKVAAMPENFAATIQAALADDPRPARARRLEVAREHTWDKLAARLLPMLTA